MKKESFGFTIETAYGNKLDAAITATAEYDKYESYSEIPEKERPDEKEILNFVNAKNKASARASATTSALDAAGIKKPTLETSAELRLATIVKALVAAGQSEDAATQQAKTLLGID